MKARLELVPAAAASAAPVARLLVERCAHESESGMVLEYAAGGITRRFLSCGMAECNRAGEQWLAGDAGACGFDGDCPPD